MTPAGGTERVQVDPPSSVTMMDAECPPSSPTATHVAELADGGFGAHETAAHVHQRGKLAVVCQLGCRGAGRRGGDLAAEHSGEGEGHHRRERDDGQSSDRAHGHLLHARGEMIRHDRRIVSLDPRKFTGAVRPRKERSAPSGFWRGKDDVGGRPPGQDVGDSLAGEAGHAGPRGDGGAPDVGEQGRPRGGEQPGVQQPARRRRRRGPRRRGCPPRAHRPAHPRPPPARGRC